MNATQFFTNEKPIKTDESWTYQELVHWERLCEKPAEECKKDNETPKNNAK